MSASGNESETTTHLSEPPLQSSQPSTVPPVVSAAGDDTPISDETSTAEENRDGRATAAEEDAAEEVVSDSEASVKKEMSVEASVTTTTAGGDGSSGMIDDSGIRVTSQEEDNNNNSTAAAPTIIATAASLVGHAAGDERDVVATTTPTVTIEEQNVVGVPLDLSAATVVPESMANNVVAAAYEAGGKGTTDPEEQHAVDVIPIAIEVEKSEIALGEDFNAKEAAASLSGRQRKKNVFRWIAAACIVTVAVLVVSCSILFLRSNNDDVAAMRSSNDLYSDDEVAMLYMREVASGNLPTVYSYGSDPPRSSFPLGPCTGDCDNDYDCREGFRCYQRDEPFAPVYGCAGAADDDSENDYCAIDPDGPVVLPYVAGKLTREKEGLLLSEGLDARIVARSRERVPYGDGTTESAIPFHEYPDGAATFPDTRGNNPGGWVYVSNSEGWEGEGGVGALTFDASGEVVDYRMVLTNTTWNSGGGRTPWNTWVSCEETRGRQGRIYQVDPFGERPAEVLTLGSGGGEWESFACDARDANNPFFFATEDHERGCLRRFAPNMTSYRRMGSATGDNNIFTGAWTADAWSMLHVDGTIDYLLLYPFGGNASSSSNNGTFEWTNNQTAAMDNAERYYPETEGMDQFEGYLYFVSKKEKSLFILDLDAGTYTRECTERGLFDGSPEKLQRIIGDDESAAAGAASNNKLLYFGEDDADDNHGIHARNANGDYFTILEGHCDEDATTTGLAFSPDGTHMYMAFYGKKSILFDVWRRDGLSFEATHLDVEYRARRNKKDSYSSSSSSD